MTPSEIRKHHFERLNNYRHSAEYAEYAKAIGAEVPQGDLPCLIGDRWEIDSEVYHEFLEMLPPLGWRGGSFYMREFSFDDLTAKFSKEGDKYFCEFARYPERAKAVVETPWGVADTVKEIAPGITLYTTPSHGGFHLSPARVASMPKCLREFVPFGGKQAGPGMWLEEDCDWSVAAIAFPQFFKPEDIQAALATLKGYRPEVYAEVVAAGIGQGGSGQRLGTAAQLRTELLQPGKVYVVDRGYESYELLADIRAAGSSFVARVQQDVAFEVARERPVSAAATVGVVRDVLLSRLGAGHHKDGRQGQPLRLVVVENRQHRAGEPKTLYLLTDQVEWAAELVALAYRYRWSVETCQADCTSSRRWVGARRIGYHRRDGVARVGRVVPATPGRPHRRNRMSDATRRPTPPRA